MKNKTNISVKNILGQKVTPSIELGHSEGYVSGDLLDANATLALIKQKIDEVINGASSAADTLKEIEDIIAQINNNIATLDSKINQETQNRITACNEISSKLSTVEGIAYTQPAQVRTDLNIRIDDEVGKINLVLDARYQDVQKLYAQTYEMLDRLNRIENMIKESEEDGPTGIPAED